MGCLLWEIWARYKGTALINYTPSIIHIHFEIRVQSDGIENRVQSDGIGYGMELIIHVWTLNSSFPVDVTL